MAERTPAPVLVRAAPPSGVAPGVARIALRVAAVALGCAVLAGCASGPGGKKKYMFEEGSRWGKAATRRYNDGDVIPPGGGRAMVGKPYEVDGRTYVPREDPNYDRVGMASWYGVDFHGRDTSNGEVYDRHTLSAAHPTLPLPSYARVTNLRNGRSVVVRVNDRGPFVAGREIDLSERAADILGYKGQGVAKVRVQYVGPAAVDGSDQRMLAATVRDGGTSIASDRTMIARAEGGAMPAAVPQSIAVARLDPPRPDQIRTNPQRSEPPPRPQYASASLQPLPALPPVTAAPRPVAAAAAPPPPARPRAETQPVIPAEILAAVRPPARPTDLRTLSAQPVPQPPAPRAATVPHPDDSLPAGWYVPQPPRQRSYAPAIATAAAPIFARLADESAAGPVIDLGLYSDPARAAALGRAFASLGTVSATPVAPGAGVVAVSLASRDDRAALEALALARSLGTERAVLLAAPRGL